MVLLTSPGILERAGEVDWLQWVTPEDGGDPGEDHKQSGHFYGLSDTDDDGNDGDDDVCVARRCLDIIPNQNGEQRRRPHPYERVRAASSRTAK